MSGRTFRLGLVSCSVGLALVAIALRLGQLALVDGERLTGLAGRQHFATEELQPIRGAILDRSGQPLALSVEAGSIYVRPTELPRDPRPSALAEDLGITPSEFLRKVSGPAKFVWVKRQAVPRELELLREADVPGFGVMTERRRLYPQGRLASSVLGFAGIDSQGLEGIELAYDSQLRGASHAVGVARDAYGRKIFARGVEGGPRQGADVVLTLDVALQYAAERALDAQVAATRAKGGLAIVLDPRTGEVLALAQNPSFDPNRPAMSRVAARKNHAIADAFEPGSTMKGLLAAAALEEGVARLDERFFCENGAYRIGRRTIHDHHPYGWLTFPEVFHFSSNICSAKLGERLGVERYARILEAFGIGKRTGIDLTGEQAGIVRPRSAWKPIDLATASFGHGIALTPLQLAVAYGTLANGGVRMRPYVVKRVVAEDGSVLVENRPTIERRVVSEATATRVGEILEGVVAAKGTGKAAAVPGLRIAGKTGTAQKVDFERGGYGRGRIASFVGYFPVEAPALVVSVVVDEPKTSVYGGTVAAPVFREIALAAAERYGLRSDPALPEPELLQNASVVVADETPTEESRTSFLGLSLAEALRQARAQGLVLEIRGAGYVVDQRPAPGFASEPGTVVELRLDSGEGPPA
jgi:cell division protein FtsI (penicillin-binding protein 3)